MSKFKVGDKVRALANPTDRYYSNEGYFKVGEEFTVKEVFDRQETVRLVERGQHWHESRFELIEKEEPSLITNFKVGDKVRRKPDSYCFDWTHKETPCVITGIYVRRDGTQSLTLKDVEDIGWDGYRFELVEEPKPAAPVVPQLPGIPEGFRAVRVGTPMKGEWFIGEIGVASQATGYMRASCYTILEKIDQPAAVEPPKPVEPVEPVKKAAPTFKVGDKVRLVDNRGYPECPTGTVDTVVHKSPGILNKGDLLQFEGSLKRSGGMYAYRFELVEEVKPETPVQPKFKKGDKYKCVAKGILDCTQGKVYEVIEDSDRDFIFKDDVGDRRQRRLHCHTFELVTESPDDLVFQDLVPAREGIDFGWWVNSGDFSSFKPTLEKTWKMGAGWSECVGLMHGHADAWDSKLAIMCYRKDLPVLPTTETVMLTEYVVWDNGEPKVIRWAEEDPSVDNGSLCTFDNAHPTGNTRTVEVPVVKP